MHDVEIGAATLIMIFLKIYIRGNPLCDLSGVVSTTSFIVENSKSNGRFSMIQLEFFSP